MTANHEHTPSQEMFRLAYKHILDNWLITPEGRQQALGEYDRMIAQVEAAAEQRGAIKALREAQQIVAGDMTIAEQRGRRGADKVDAAYLIRELDQEIQDLQEGDDETH